MKTRLATLALALLAAVAAVSAAPSRAAAQCQWGCTCEGNACGCNSKGSGGRCDAGGTGCVVTGCMPTNTSVELTPDGTVLQVAVAEQAGDSRMVAFAGFTRAAEPREVPRAEEELGGRWEYVASGRAVARHCSGMVVARYFDPDAAEAARKRSRAIRI